MEVATLTATLEAEVSKFSAAMVEADRKLDTVRDQIEATERSAKGLAAALNTIEYSDSQAQKTVNALDRVLDALSEARLTAVETARAISEVYLGPGQAAVTAANAKSEVNSLHDIRNAALEAAAAISAVSLASTRNLARRRLGVPYGPMNEWEAMRAPYFQRGLNVYRGMRLSEGKARDFAFSGGNYDVNEPSWMERFRYAIEANLPLNWNLGLHWSMSSRVAQSFAGVSPGGFFHGGDKSYGLIIKAVILPENIVPYSPANGMSIADFDKVNQEYQYYSRKLATFPPSGWEREVTARPGSELMIRGARAYTKDLGVVDTTNMDMNLVEVSHEWLEPFDKIKEDAKIVAADLDNLTTITGSISGSSSLIAPIDQSLHPYLSGQGSYFRRSAGSIIPTTDIMDLRQELAETTQVTRSMSEAMRESAVDIPRVNGKFISDFQAAANNARDLSDALRAARYDVDKFVNDQINSINTSSPDRIFVVPPGGGGADINQLRAPYTGGYELLPMSVVEEAQAIIEQNVRRRNQLLEEGFNLSRKFGQEELPPNPVYNFTNREANDAAARAYLKKKGVDVSVTPLGFEKFTRGKATQDALIAGALGLGAQSGARKVLADLGWGAGTGLHIPGFGVVGGGGRGGFGLFGRNIFGGMAGFGTPLGLAGFGAERALFSSIGILGSFAGGILGGGVLGLGALGTMAVGAGTNMAGIGQAAGDIKTVSTDLGNLKTAIQEYGKNSTQAADAQAQLNQDLRGFSPAARGAVLAAAQTSQQFKSMFDKLTGPAEKIGAEIINQAMQVGEKFLPTIGKFAHQNMQILQSGLQPFFSWLTKGGNAKNMISDINKLTTAIREHGKHSVQANQANQQLIRDQRNVGGLGLFRNLEEVFQKNFPTAIHAGEQGFELLMKTIDIAAQHLGHFMTTLNNFFTRMNNQDFGKWAAMVEKLIGLFSSWVGMFASFGKLVFSIFQPAVGLGQAFAELMTRIFNQIRSYINQQGTQDILHKLFDVHLEQLIKQIGGLIMNMLPIVESIASAFIQLEAYAAGAFGKLIGVLRDTFGWINKIGGGFDKWLGWALAARIIIAANKVLLGGLMGFLRGIPLIGSLFGTAASETTTATGEITGAIDRVNISVLNLTKSLRDLGPAAAAGADEADAALSEMGVVSTASARAGALSLTGGNLLVRRGGLGMLGKASMFAITGIIAKQLIQSIFPGHAGNQVGNVALGAGLGAGVGAFVGMPEVGAGVGALGGVIYDLIHKGPSATDQIKKMAAAAAQFGAKAQHAAAEGHRFASVTYNKAVNQANSGVLDSILKITDATKREADAQQKQTAQQVKSNTAAAQQAYGVNLSTTAINNITAATTRATQSYQNGGTALNQWIQKMQAIQKAVESVNPQMATAIGELIKIAQAVHRIPSHKTITITVREMLKKNFIPGDLFAPGAAMKAGEGGTPGPHLQFQLPARIRWELLQASAGHYSQAKADKAAYDFYQKQLQEHGLTSAQRKKLLQLQAQYYTGLYGTPGGLPKGVHAPATTTALYKQFPFLRQSELQIEKARLDIANGNVAAGRRLLLADQKLLEQKLAEAKTTEERLAITRQLNSIASLLHRKGVSKTSSYQLPLALQEAMARADAIAALNPNLQGPTSLQVKLAQQAKAAAMKAINSHKLTMQGMIDAWNIVAQANAVLAQKLTNKLAMYHKVSTDAIEDQIKGLNLSQQIALREALAQRDAHRGYAPNQGYQPGSSPASPHHRRHPGSHSPLYTGPGGGVPHPGGGNIIIQGDLVLNGVQNKAQLWAEMKALDRKHHQRSGGRR